MLRKLTLMLIFSLVLAACAPAGAAPEAGASGSITLTDGLGRTLTLDSPPTRIVSTSPSITQILFAIGAGGQVVGRDEYSIYPEEALEVTDFGSLYGEFPAEAILALEPDMVIAADIIPEEQVQAIEDLGLPVYWQADPVDFEDLYANLLALAGMTGREAEARVLIESLQARVAAVEEKVASVEERPLVFYELDATDPANPWTSGSGTFIDTIITLAGGENMGAVLEGDYAQISSEEVIAQNPDIILLADEPYGITVESVGERAGWEVIAAVQNDQVVPFDPNILSVPGPRLVDGLEMVAEILHPELFE
jgi:iron complex transport system substrate-binding protein